MQAKLFEECRWEIDTKLTVRVMGSKIWATSNMDVVDVECVLLADKGDKEG